MSDQESTEKPYDIILWGATGHAGRPTALHLQRHHGANSDQPVKWAMAGRTKEKLEATRKECGDPNLEIFIVPGGDVEGCHLLASKAKVIIATIAPSLGNVTPMIEACIEHGTHFCDLSGELHWLRQIYDDYHEKAAAAGVKIVNGAGVGCAPCDYLVHVMQKAAKEQTGEYLTSIVNALSDGYLAISGGSFASGKSVIEATLEDEEMADMIANPYSLNPAGELSGPDCPEIEKIEYHKGFETYIMPFPFGQCNARMVRRGHALLGYPWGKEFTYVETRIAGDSLVDRFKAHAEDFAVNLFIAARPNTLLGKIMYGAAPKMGEGPSEKQMRKYAPCCFDAIGTTPSGKEVRGWVYSPWDGSHGGTAALIAEAAYCLAMRNDEMNANGCMQGGLLTPYLAMGDVFTEQAALNASFWWGVEEKPPEVSYPGISARSPAVA